MHPLPLARWVNLSVAYTDDASLCSPFSNVEASTGVAFVAIVGSGGWLSLISSVFPSPDARICTVSPSLHKSHS